MGRKAVSGSYDSGRGWVLSAWDVGMHSIAADDASVDNVQWGFTRNNCDAFTKHL